MTLLLPLSIVLISFLGKFSVAQSPTPAPTYLCQDTLIPFAYCLDGNGADVQACDDCLDAIFDSLTSQTPCTEATSTVCGFLASCSSVCGGTNCASYAEAYEGCLIGPTCFGGCSSTPSSPVAAPSPVMPTPTSPSLPTAPAPTPTSTTDDGTVCPDQATAFATCVEGSGLGTTACLSCIQDYGSSTSGPTTTCDGAESITCGSAAACLTACGDCVDAQVALVNCVNADVCSPISCSSTPTVPDTSLPPAAAPTSGLSTPPPSSAAVQCEDELAAFATCVTSAGQSTASCGTCITGYLPDTVATCDDSELYTCGAMDACPECGPCQDEYAAISNCGNQGQCDTITCTSTPSTPTTAATLAPVTTPLSSPTLAVAESPTRSPVGGNSPTKPTNPAVVDTSSAGRPRFATLLTVVVGTAFTVVTLVL